MFIWKHNIKLLPLQTPKYQTLLFPQTICAAWIMFSIQKNIATVCFIYMVLVSFNAMINQYPAFCVESWETPWAHTVHYILNTFYGANLEHYEVGSNMGKF